MGAYAGLSHYFNKPLYEYAVELGYDESNILILKGDVHSLQDYHLNIYKNLLSCRHQSDNRASIEYGRDLVASWIFEDYFIQQMQNDKFEITLSGADKTRLILPNKMTSTNSDYLIRTLDGYEITMELVNDYTGFWYKNHKLHLRDNKYLELKNNQSLLLAIALSANIQKYTLFDFRKEISAVKIPSHKPYGGKPAYEISVVPNSLFNFSFSNIKETILDTLGGL